MKSFQNLFTKSKEPNIAITNVVPTKENKKAINFDVPNDCGFKVFGKIFRFCHCGILAKRPSLMCLAPNIVENHICDTRITNINCLAPEFPQDKLSFLVNNVLLSHYKRVQVLSNSFSLVYLVKSVTTNEQFILKEIKEDGLREIHILQQLNHPNIIKLKEVIQPTLPFKLSYIVIEKVEGGCLMTDVEKPSNCPPKQYLQRYFSDLMKAVAYLQELNIIHNDIKPSNCLLSFNNHLILSDFGTAYSLANGVPDNISAGSPAFSAPELHQKNPNYGFHNDIWSCGVTLYMMATGRTPFMGANVLKTYENIINIDPTFPSNMRPYLKQLILRILSKNPENRPCIDQIIQHRWLCENRKNRSLSEQSENHNFIKHEV